MVDGWCLVVFTGCTQLNLNFKSLSKLHYESMDFAECTLNMIYSKYSAKCLAVKKHLALAGTAAFERMSCFSVSSIIYLLKKIYIKDQNTQWWSLSWQIRTEFKEAYKCELLSQSFFQRCNSMLVLIRWDPCRGRPKALDSCWWNCSGCRLTLAHRGGNILRPSKCNFSFGSLPDCRTAEVVRSTRFHAEKQNILDRFTLF